MGFVNYPGFSALDLGTDHDSVSQCVASDQY